MSLKIVQDSPDDLVNSMQSKLDVANNTRDKAGDLARACDVKIRELIKSLPPKPRDSAEQLREQVKKLQMRQNTTSMSLNEEKKLIKELEGSSKLIKTIDAYEKVQAQIDELREQKNEHNGVYKQYDAEGKEMKSELTQTKISAKLGVDAGSLETEIIEIPEEWIGAIIGKKGSRKAEIENECGVELNVDVKGCTAKITGTPGTIRKAKETIKSITDAVSEDSSLDDDKFNILLSNKGALLKQVQTEHIVRIDLKRAGDGGKGEKCTGDFTVKGLPQNVKAAIAAIKEATSGFEEVSVEEKQIPQLVGKGGVVIRKIQEDSGAYVDINRDGPSLRIRGTRKSVKAAVSLIEGILADNEEIEFEIPINKEFISAIVGAKGVVIQKMQKDSGFCKFDVVKDDPDEPFIRIKGRKDQLELGKQVYAETLAEIEKQFRSIPLSQAMVSSVIGKGGATIKKLQEDSGARISYDRKNSVLRLRGEGDDPTSQMDKAEELIRALLKENEITEVSVTPEMIQVLLTKKGEEITKLQKESGLNINVNKDTNSLVFRGPEEKVEIANAMLAELQIANQSLEIPVAEEDFSLLIGSKGATINKISEETGAKVNIMKNSNSVKIMGTAEALEKAKDMINGLLNGGEGGLTQVVDIDSDSMGALIGPKGATIKKLQEGHDVRIDLLRSRDCIRIRANAEDEDSGEKVADCVKEIAQILATVKSTTTVKVTNPRTQTQGKTWDEIKAVGGELDVSINYKEESKEGFPVVIISGSGSAVNEAKRRVQQIMTGKAVAEILIQKKHMDHMENSKANLDKIEVDRGVKITLNNLGLKIQIEGLNSDVSKANMEVLATLGFFFPSEFSHAKIPVGSSAFFMRANKKVIRTIEEASGAKCSIDSATSLMNMCGEEDSISKAKDALEEQVGQYEKENASIILDRAMVSMVIGKKGATIGKIQDDTGARIKVDSAGGHCRITGDEESVAACLAVIQEMKDKWAKENKVIDIDPELVGTLIGKAGCVIKSMTEETGCQIDIDSQSGTVRLRGEEDKIAAAEELIHAKLAENKIVRMEIDERDFRLVIGTKGATIRQLQEDSGASIDLDRDNSQVSFRGTEEECAKAKELVDAIIEANTAEREAWQEQKDAERAAEDAEWEKSRESRKKEGGAENPEKDEKSDFVFQYEAVPLGGGAGYASKSATSKSAAKRARKKANPDGADPEAEDVNVTDTLGLQKKVVKKVEPPKPKAKPGVEFHAANKAYALRLI